MDLPQDGDLTDQLKKAQKKFTALAEKLLAIHRLLVGFAALLSSQGLGSGYGHEGFYGNAFLSRVKWLWVGSDFQDSGLTPYTKSGVIDLDLDPVWVGW